MTPRPAGIAGVFAWLFALAAPAALPPEQHLLPPETIGFVLVPDAGPARAAWETQAPARLWRDPGMREVRTRLVARWTSRVLQPAEDLTGFAWSELPAIAGGGVLIALLPGPGGRTDHVLLLETGTNAPAAQRRIAAMRAGTDGAPSPARTRLAGIEFVALDLPAEQVAAFWNRAFPATGDSAEPAAVSRTLHLGMVGDVLVISTAARPAETVARRLLEWRGGDRGSASVTNGSTAESIVVLRGGIRGSWIVERLGDGALTGALGSFSAMPAILDASGLRALKEVAWELRANAAGWWFDVDLRVPAASRKGLLQILDLPAASAAPPPLVPAEALGFTRARLSGPLVWRRLQRMLLQVNPVLLGMLQLFTEYGGGTDFSFERDLVGMLGDDWISVTFDGQGGAERVWLIGSPDAQALYRAIRAVATSDFLAMLGPGGGRAPRAREVEVRGVRIGSLEFPPGPFAEHGIEVHFAAREGFLVLSSSRPLLERMLSARGPSLAERPGVANAFTGAGGTDGGFASWLDERAAMRGVFEDPDVARAYISDRMGWLAASDLGRRAATQIARWIDAEQLPPYGVAARYFGHAATGARVTPDGIRIRVYRPKPAEADR